jgi:hypothetical protein
VKSTPETTKQSGSALAALRSHAQYAQLRAEKNKKAAPPRFGPENRRTSPRFNSENVNPSELKKAPYYKSSGEVIFPPTPGEFEFSHGLLRGQKIKKIRESS